jgi:hypothetical protein
MDKMAYEIRTTWDNQTSPDNAEITLKFSRAKTQNGTDGDLLIQVEAPFFDDPKLPEGTPAGFVDGLWDYEVVEIFLLGTDGKYLEIELGPRGHYLVYFLEGARNVTNSHLTLENYTAEVSGDGKRWKGEALIPPQYLPQGLNKFNAYAIHKSDPGRVYMSLFPVPTGKFQNPDFHRLEYFQPFTL